MFLFLSVLELPTDISELFDPSKGKWFHGDLLAIRTSAAHFSKCPASQCNRLKWMNLCLFFSLESYILLYSRMHHVWPSGRVDVIWRWVSYSPLMKAVTSFLLCLILGLLLSSVRTSAQTLSTSWWPRLCLQLGWKRRSLWSVWCSHQSLISELGLVPYCVYGRRLLLYMKKIVYFWICLGKEKKKLFVYCWAAHRPEWSRWCQPLLRRTKFHHLPRSEGKCLRRFSIMVAATAQFLKRIGRLGWICGYKRIIFVPFCSCRPSCPIFKCLISVFYVCLFFLNTILASSTLWK